MHFKTVRLMAINNGPKRTIFTSSRFELLHMVSELDTGWCASEDARLPKRVDCEIPHQLK